MKMTNLILNTMHDILKKGRYLASKYCFLLFRHSCFWHST